MKLIKFFLIYLLCTSIQAIAKEYFYILNDNCINILYQEANSQLKNSDVDILRDSRGIIIRYNLKNPHSEFYGISSKTYKKIKEMEYFLAKIENPAIIEVHIGELVRQEAGTLKKWEISTVIANNIESIMTKPSGTIDQDRINSIGYGEFLPAKNTSNNGGKEANRIDIIVLCNISGE